MKKLIPACLFSLFVFLSFFAPRILAHEVEFMTIKTAIDVQGKFIELETAVGPPLMIQGPGDESQMSLTQDYFQRNMKIAVKGKPCSFSLKDYFVSEERQQTIFTGTLACPEPAQRVADMRITSTIFTELFPEFDHFVNVNVNGKTEKIVLNQNVKTFPYEKGETSGKKIESKKKGSADTNFWIVASRFTRLGAEHILFGLDHILFLLAVIMIVRSLKNILILVTSFTLGHSITLILAGLNIITLTSRIVEPLIAASIVYMAVRNIWLTKKHKITKDTGFGERRLLAFAFGLIHGLGFAGALSEIQIPKEYFITALVTFNIGVEIGQLMILSYIVPWLELSILTKWKWRNKSLLVLNILIGLIALVWTIQRIFFT